MSPYEFTDYKAYLVDFIRKNKRRGLITEIAKAAGCSHSYLSQVLHGKPEITPDQAIAAAEYLALTEEEASYFLLLVLFARASTPKLRQHLRGQISDLRTKQMELTERVKKTADAKLGVADQEFYYSSWAPGAIHVLTACEEFQNPVAIAERLQLSLSSVKKTLDRLVDCGLVKKKNGCYSHSGLNLHLPSKSPFVHANHLNWRMRAIQSSEDSGAIHYTSAFAISRSDRDAFKEMLLHFIEEQRARAIHSGSEDVVAFCCNFFAI